MLRLRSTSLIGCLVLAAAPGALAQEGEVIPLSELAREVASDPDKVEAFLSRMGQNPAAAGLLSPAQKEAVRAAIRRGDFGFLDRFPGVTVAGLGEAVRASELAKRARTGPGAPAQGDPASGGDAGLPVEEGPTVAVEELGIPTDGPALEPGSLWKDLGGGIRYGDAVDPDKATRYADGARLADLLNRLADNVRGKPPFRVQLGERTAVTPKGLLALLEASGHTIEVIDARAMANFGDLYYQERDVATPFWVDSQVPVPGTDRTLLVPVTHSEHELIVRGPRVNTEVAFFFGIDSEAKFRPMGSKGQSWIGGRVMHRYTGAQAREAIRLASAIRRAYQTKQKKWPGVGYFPLGVCNDVNAMLELHLQGKTTLYPLTRDLRYFQGAGEVDVLARRLPVDGRAGTTPDVGRVLASLPVESIDDLAFPTLRADLQRFDGAAQAALGPTPGVTGTLQEHTGQD